MLYSYPRRTSVLSTIAELDNGGRYTNDRVVSSVTFGFWTYLFTRVPFRRGGSTLLQIFPAKTVGLGQRAIFNELQTIKDFRNRIAHHEAICFDSTGTKSTVSVRANYALVIKYIQFLGYQESHIYLGLDILPDKIMQKIDTL